MSDLTYQAPPFDVPSAGDSLPVPFTGGTKLVKVSLTLASTMGIALVYSLLFNLVLAIGLVMMALVQELGRMLAFRKLGLMVWAEVFVPIPMLGVATPTRGIGWRNRHSEAFIVFSGLLLACLANMALLAGVMLASQPAGAFAFATFMSVALNLVQMMPIRLLDGGRFVQAVGACAMRKQGTRPCLSRKAKCYWLGGYLLLCVVLGAMLLMSYHVAT
jgi:Zn-dependent protease